MFLFRQACNRTCLDTLQHTRARKRGQAQSLPVSVGGTSLGRPTGHGLEPERPPARAQAPAPNGLATCHAGLVPHAVRSFPRCDLRDNVVESAPLTARVLRVVDIPPFRADHFYESQIELLRQGVVEGLQIVEQILLLIGYVLFVVLARASPDDFSSTAADVHDTSSAVVREGVDEERQLARDQHTMEPGSD